MSDTLYPALYQSERALVTCFLRIGLCSGLFGLLIQGVRLIYYDRVFSCSPGFRTQGS